MLRSVAEEVCHGCIPLLSIHNCKNVMYEIVQSASSCTLNNSLQPRDSYSIDPALKACYGHVTFIRSVAEEVGLHSALIDTQLQKL